MTVTIPPPCCTPLLAGKKRGKVQQGGPKISSGKEAKIFLDGSEKFPPGGEEVQQGSTTGGGAWL